jgi:hypothetical protein
MPTKKDTVPVTSEPAQVQASPAPTIALTAENIAAIVAEAVKAANKPFGYDDMKARMDKYREDAREDARAFREMVADKQRACPHRRSEDGKATIFWTNYMSEKIIGGGIRFGVCSRCQIDIMPDHKDYHYWLSQPSSTVDLR